MSPRYTSLGFFAVASVVVLACSTDKIDLDPATSDAGVDAEPGEGDGEDAGETADAGDAVDAGSDAAANADPACVALLDGIVEDECATCMATACCEEVAACHDKSVCWDNCFTVHDETKCHSDDDAHLAYHAMGDCAADHCEEECE